MKNILDIEVSCFANYYTEENPRPINLQTWLKSKKYAHLVERIRATDDKKERDKLKAQLPAITPSGLFSRREEAGLVKHSGLIQIDIDGHENKHIGNFSAIKEQLRKLPEIAYLGLSVSGKGFWGLIPLAYPEKHKEQFQALRTDFAKWGLVLDEKPKNVASLRGYSYDNEAYFNPQAKPYFKIWKPQPEVYRGQYYSPANGSEVEKVEACLAGIEAGRIDITGSYSEWFSLGCSLANEFGEAGRGYFHKASQFYPGYSSKEADKQFSYCLRRQYRYSIATFYQICKDYGITFKEAFIRPQNEPEQPTAQAEPVQAQETANKQADRPPIGNQPTPKQEKTALKPSPQADGLPPGWKWKVFSPTHKVLLDADGLPATWNLCPKNELERKAIEREEVRTGVKANPAAGQLINTFGLVLEVIEDWEPEAV